MDVTSLHSVMTREEVYRALDDKWPEDQTDVCKACGKPMRHQPSGDRQRACLTLSCRIITRYPSRYFVPKHEFTALQAAS